MRDRERQVGAPWTLRREVRAVTFQGIVVGRGRLATESILVDADLAPIKERRQRTGADWVRRQNPAQARTRQEAAAAAGLVDGIGALATGSTQIDVFGTVEIA